jgi:recombinational DNA repair ATPase RecF
MMSAMSITDFRAQLRQNRKGKSFGRWHKIDLHNHSPLSFDYQDKGPDVASKLVQSIREKKLSVVMFTDHNCLPDLAFTTNIAHQSGALILRGVEMNVFVDAHGKPNDKIDQDAFYHFLIGFDPDNGQSPEYWLEHLKKRCDFTDKVMHDKTIQGLTARIDQIVECLAESNAILIPAHLHDKRGAFQARAIDEVYNDKSFLQFVHGFTALEVISPATATYFDGKHPETNNLFKNCIQSSDSHSPDKLGWRSSWAKLEKLTFAELKAALELPGRIRLEEPKSGRAWIEAIHIEGGFLQDTWLEFSPECNMFIAVKGSGKTSVLECLRFALGVKIPTSKTDQVTRHLQHILGPSGRVQVMMTRKDGQQILVERKVNEPFMSLSFEHGEPSQVTDLHAFGFDAQILGWGEIEEAANDSAIRRRYLDEIAGSESIQEFDNTISNLQVQLQQQHNLAHLDFKTYESLSRQVAELQRKKTKLKQLQDAQIIEMLQEYELVAAQVTSFQRTVQALDGSDQRATQNLSGLYQPASIEPLRQNSPLLAELSAAVGSFDSLGVTLQTKGVEIAQSIQGILVTLREQLTQTISAKQAFDEKFEQAKGKLDPEQRQLLDQHRQVADETSALPGLISEHLAKQQAIRDRLQSLHQICNMLAGEVEKRTRTRQAAVETLSVKLEQHSVRLALQPHLLHRLTEVGNSRPVANQRFQNLVISQGSGVWQRGLEKLYFEAQQETNETQFKKIVSDLFEESDMQEFVGLIQDDDLHIEFEPHKGTGFKPINNLSAGQRCTAIFPILLNVGHGPLIVDQPEDNLDNRYISNEIAPALVREKEIRQLMFTSHNANLVVLSDCENIIAFESDGNHGYVADQGFLATSSSSIKEHVLGILDGGRKALEQRTLKYGVRDT